MSENDKEPSIGLKRALSLPMITFYGLGTIVGGGFYALLGKVSQEAGMLTPWALLLTSGIALLSAFSFAELSARFPVSGGEAYYVNQATRRTWISSSVGWMVIATGVVSAATLANAFAGFMDYLVDFPQWLTVVMIVIGWAQSPFGASANRHGRSSSSPASKSVG